ncbi:NAD kinase [Campylobacter majalis]|uniref:NAD kinase n=1 Tax=Campylobacter majalis TaxID=2790656 RepID=A0ABN7K5S4_9BACT|nr:NAD(+) kinase [Campylobacter majalis]CAD7287460.1 NAD kinase [Campylobacter majalis]
MQNSKKFALVAKQNNQLEKNYKILVEILSKYDVEILAEKSLSDRLGIVGYELKDLAKKCELIISLGGDGTLISTCRKIAQYNVAVLGIHAGTLGFLTDVAMSGIEKFFIDYFNGVYNIHEPYMLDILLEKQNGEILKKIAFNDAVIMRAKPASMAKIQAYLNDKIFNSYYGDGVIVSSPVGSTAYNMSAGGSIIYPLSSVFTLTPICSHSFSQRPIILPFGFSVEFRAYMDEVLVIDGQDTFKMANYKSVRVGLSNHRAKLIRSVSRDYFQILKEKLCWGQE